MTSLCLLRLRVVGEDVWVDWPTMVERGDVEDILEVAANYIRERRGDSTVALEADVIPVLSGVFSLVHTEVGNA